MEDPGDRLGGAAVDRPPRRETSGIGVEAQHGQGAVGREGANIVCVRDDNPAGTWTAAPLWGLGAPVAERLCLDRPPYELGNAYQSAIDHGETILAIEIGKTRDWTYPLDLVKENFSYLRSI